MELERYKELFISEAEEYLEQIYDILAKLKKGHTEKELLFELMSNTHSIKGMSRTVGFSEIEKLSHKLEDFIQQFTDRQPIETDALDLLFKGFELLEQMIENAKSNSPQDIPYHSFLKKLETAHPTAQKQSPIPNKEVSLPKLKTISYARVKTETLDNMLNIIGEILICQNRLETISKTFASRELKAILYQMSELVKELHLQISIARMMPIKILTDRISRLINNLASAAGKEIVFRVMGEDIEMDRAIIEGIEEPLLHVIRNAIDHGIETPQERENKNKPRKGTITLTISKTKDNFLIQVEDDGKGIKSELLKQKAVEKGILTQEEAKKITPEDALMLIFSPGFSTAKEITKTSGRGMGMNIIKKKIEALGGNITLSSQEGVGSRFVFHLPLSVSIMPAFIVRIKNYFFAIPVNKVISNVKILPEEIFLQKQKEFFTFRNSATPLFQLNKLLKIDTPLQADEGYLSVIVVEIYNRNIGLIVDEFVGQQEVVIRPLNPPLHNITVFSGITLLGNGQITLVLNLEELDLN